MHVNQFTGTYYWLIKGRCFIFILSKPLPSMQVQTKMKDVRIPGKEPSEVHKALRW